MTHSRLPILAKILPHLADWGEGITTDEQWLQESEGFYKILAGKQCPHCGSLEVNKRATKTDVKGRPYSMFQCKKCKRTFSGKKFNLGTPT
jgi:predicted SprT family Zn-dependent metalloprotease